MILETGTNDFKLELAREKERILFMQAPVSNITIQIMAVLLFFIVQGRVDQQYLIAWTVFTILFSGLRLVIWYAHKLRPTLHTINQWITSYTSFTGWLGMMFGLCYLFGYQNQDLVVNFTLILMLFSIITAAGYVLSCHMPIFYVYTYPQVLIFAAVLFSYGTTSHALISLAMLLYLAMLTVFTRNAHKQFVRSVQLQFDNRHLIADLNKEVEQREEMIRRRTRELVDTNIDLERKEMQLKRNERSLQFLAHHDTLTGLPNRLLLVDRLTQSINKAERAATGLAVMFIDLDYFKEINDSLGHTTGDELLKAVAENLRHSIRKEDTAARLGGDEFTIILEELEDEGYVTNVAEKLLETFRKPVRLQDRDLNISASIGISLYPEHGEDTETLLRNADTAMYQAKHEGRNGYSIYSQEMTERAISKLALESTLRKAVGNNELLLHYQPQIDLWSGKVIGVEALLRWQHPQQGFLYPDRFIAVAEDTGLIDDIGLWVIKHACERVVAWRRAGIIDLSIAVNISGRQLLDETLGEKITSIFKETGCDPGALEFEITEGYLIEHPEKAAVQINDLRNTGVNIAIDDFGTGYSSLTHLKQFPISKLKIDASFIRDIMTDENDKAITRAIIALGKSLDLTVIAEGVENEQQQQFLMAEGCEQAQGYHIARPVAEAELLDYLKPKLSAVQPV